MKLSITNKISEICLNLFRSEKTTLGETLVIQLAVERLKLTKEDQECYGTQLVEALQELTGDRKQHQ